jgi:DNA-binding transcriptional LysR family regulator
MDHRQLRAFIEVFDQRSITAASKSIGLSQPALSATIKELEESLGAQLFLRLPRGVEVTEEARILYPEARRMITESETLKNRFRKNKNRLPLKVGIETDISPVQIEEFIKLTKTIDSELLLTLEEGCSGEARLAAEELRCEDELFITLWEEPYVLAASAQCSHYFDDLLSAPWIVTPKLEIHQRLLPLYGINASTPAAEADNLRFALNLAAAGVGIAVVPKSLVNLCPLLVEKEIPNISLTRRIGICYAAQALMNPAVLTLVKMLKMDKESEHQAITLN